MLELHQIWAGYGPESALRGVNLKVAAGQIVALVGANGAGKSTLAKVVSGLIVPSQGHVVFDGNEIEKLGPRLRVKAGIVHVPEGREVFSGLSVRDNLLMGAFTVANIGGEAEARIREACASFPELLKRLDSPAGNLSGGQQQMLAIARGLMAKPKLLILDEPSLGLAPLLVAEIFAIIATLRRQGLAILLSEQNARLSLDLADEGYVLESGRVAMSGRASDLLADEELARRYLGAGISNVEDSQRRRDDMAAKIAPMFRR